MKSSDAMISDRPAEHKRRRRLMPISTRPDLGTKFSRYRLTCMRTYWQDAAFAFRQLKKNPGLALTAIVSLALGVGATTAVLSAG